MEPLVNPVTLGEVVDSFVHGVPNLLEVGFAGSSVIL